MLPSRELWLYPEFPAGRANALTQQQSSTVKNHVHMLKHPQAQHDLSVRKHYSKVHGMAVSCESPHPEMATLVRLDGYHNLHELSATGGSPW